MISKYILRCSATVFSYFEGFLSVCNCGATLAACSYNESANWPFPRATWHENGYYTILMALFADNLDATIDTLRIQREDV